MKIEPSAELLFTRERIQARTRELAGEITRHYASSGCGEICLVTILKGSFIFLADLIRSIDYPLTIDFMAISSYSRERGEAGVVRLTKDLSSSILGRDVLMVEGIVDTGLTLGYILKVLHERGPRSIEICTLLNKSRNRITELPVLFRGFDIDEHFVIGYGLDHGQLFRNLPDIYHLGEESLKRMFRTP